MIYYYIRFFEKKLWGKNMLSIETIRNSLAAEQYFCDEALATVISLADYLHKPLLLEGPAGVGKTEVARVMAAAFGRPFIRLQCYEGLDERHALYEWNYQKQLLFLQSQKDGRDWQHVQKDIFSDEFLLPRPLLSAFLSEQPAVLLIDEIDKSDEEFESFLLEALSDFAVTIPERGTVSAQTVPLIFLTSNGARDFSDGLKRRCVHYFIDYPDEQRELDIIRSKVPQLGADIAAQVAAFAAKLRTENLRKKPSIAETLDWARVLAALDIRDLADERVAATWNFLLKYEEDLDRLRAKQGR